MRIALGATLALMLVIGVGSMLLVAHISKEYLKDLEDKMAIAAQTLARNVPPTMANPTKRSIEELQATVMDMQAGSGSRVRILTRDGVLLADSARDAAPREPAEPDLLDRPEIQQARKGQYGAYTRFADETQRALALYVAVPALDEHGRVVGMVYVSHSTIEIMARLDRLRRPFRMVLIVLGVVALAAGLWLFTDRRRRLAKVQEATRQMAHGTLEARADTAGGDEIAQIAAHFNRLAESLQGKISELEDEKEKTRRFIQEITHELKTPLTGLRGSVDALQGGAMADESARHKFVGNIGRDAKRLAHLVSELLEYQKIENAELRRERLDLASLADTVAEDFEAEAARRRVSIEVEGGGVSVDADAGKLRRVLENLLENAVRHSPEGGRVRVQVSNGDAEVRLVVEDEGPGVDAEERERIFERFYRGARAVDSPLGDAGLGLAIAREVVLRHGGRISVEAAEPHGARFCVVLPQRAG